MPGETLLEALTRQLWEGIPLSAAAGIEVLDSGPEGVTVAAPFEPNRNYHGTVFGGSIAVLGIVTGWLTVVSGLRESGRAAEVVIQSSAVDYLEPATGTVVARASRPADWDRFVRTYDRFGRARVDVSCTVAQADRVVARHLGTYAAL